MCECKPAIEGTRIKTIQWKNRERNNPVYVDDCIKEFIENMNKHGIKTLGCCCGHSKKEHSIEYSKENNCAEVIISLDNVNIWNLGDDCIRIAIKFNPRGDTEVE